MTRQIISAITELQNGIEGFVPRALQKGAMAGKRRGLLMRVLALPFLWLRRKQDRWMLADLTDAQLKDVGLDPVQVRRESTKGFWRG